MLWAKIIAFTVKKQLIYINLISKVFLRLFDLTLRIKGFNINKAKAALQSIQGMSETEYTSYIENQKRAIINYHLKHNDFYRSKTKDINTNDWNSIPIITKKDLQQPLETILSNPFTKNTVYIDKTSGSSGDPFIFPKDKFCHALTWAQIIDRFSWYGIDFNTSKQARFYGIPLNGLDYYKERVKDLLANRYRFSVFDLSDKAFQKVLKKFSSTHFDYINGYTSSIVQFAKYLKQQDIVLKDICPTLKVCMITSEMLFEDDRSLMKTQFGVPIVNEYGASELDLIAFENPKGDWLINSETLFVEVLDDNDAPVENGQEGRLIITSLYNKAFPFIRYDIGDIGVLSKRSTTKLPILEKLIGRTNDIAILPSGKKAAGLTFYYITKRIIEADGYVKEFVVDQVAISNFKIRYVSATELSESKKQDVLNAMETYLEKGLHVDFEKCIQLNRTKSGKLKQFTSYVSY